MFKRVFKGKYMVLYIIMILSTYYISSLVLPISYKEVGAISYSYGAKGNVVTDIQSRLKRWGYYSGSADGVYGYQTYNAVKKFQGKNGLNVDGVVGDATLAALGIVSSPASNQGNSSKNYNNQDTMLLARLINGEARGEPYEGQVAVGAVIMNRTRDSRFPATIAGVVYQPGAFTAIVDGQVNANMEQNSINAARDALNGWDPSGGAVYYFNPATSTNKWIWSRPLIKVIGKHRFCN
ncbi:spore cortex-lytic enzyme [Clostridium putrefaciens]|uniref:Spore cortex-lytic enzyme n=2 Tax=Clostridium putrefaciens TaxID=99675 RepID=A0A381J7S8_9CLOT|nr:spore cortex-lytic enzyme [Clostridium putrefaciens]SUY46370.1 spore cortex-lytic enzyme [Clostridium putrefaciens]